MLIDQDDRHRADPASVRSPDFRRMLRLAWPHRRMIAIGMLASVVYGALNSASIIGLLPVMTVMVSEEGLHGWLFRSIAEQRLGAQLSVRYVDDNGQSRVRSVRVAKVYGDSPLRAHMDSGRILQVGGQSADSLQGIKSLASALAPLELVAEIDGAAATDAPTSTFTVKLNDASFKSRALAALAVSVPVATDRDGRVRTLGYLLSGLVVVVILSNLARFVAQYFVAAGVLRSMMDLRRTLYRKVLRLPMDFFALHTSDLVSRFVQDSHEIQRGLMSVFGKLVREPIKAVFVLAAALALNAQLTLTMLVVVPIVVVVFWSVGRKIRKANKRLLQKYGVMIGALTTSLHAIGVVKAYNAENLERKRLWQIDRTMFKHQLRIAKLEAFLTPMLEVLGVIVLAGFTVWLGAQVMRGDLKLAEFGTVLIALGMLLDPLRKFADVYPRVMRSAAGARRIFSIIDTPVEAELLEGVVDLPVLSEAIEFKNVTFTYPGAAAPAIQEVSLTIRCGETIALVGPNGSGKTTLTKLLIRFHDPQAGAVLVDGTDVRSARLRSLRRQISVVSQDPVVFAMTVAENIAYGSRNGDPAKIVEAARRAHADEFIRARPGGYDEVIGDRGSTLSGGQRQRICIARAVMRDAPILIFDEATSQIDSESELHIQQAVRDCAAGKTTILVAHRLSTIRFAERVVVMDGGRIIDHGSHAELLDRCSIYATICRTQLAE